MYGCNLYLGSRNREKGLGKRGRPCMKRDRGRFNETEGAHTPATQKGGISDISHLYDRSRGYEGIATDNCHPNSRWFSPADPIAAAGSRRPRAALDRYRPSVYPAR